MTASGKDLADIGFSQVIGGSLEIAAGDCTQINPSRPCLARLVTGFSGENSSCGPKIINFSGADAQRHSRCKIDGG